MEVLQTGERGGTLSITLKEHGVEFLMEHRHLWFRRRGRSAILRIRAEIIKAARDFLDDNGFTLTDPPNSHACCVRRTPALCSRWSTFERSVSTPIGQLYIGSTAMALGKVYSFGPTFRAEKSKRGDT